MDRLLLRLALRNLRRHARRTIVAGVTLAAGAAALVLNSNLVEGIRRQIVESVVIAQVGEVAVDAVSSGEADASAALVERPDEIEARIAEWLPGATAARVLGSLGVVSGPQGSSARVAVWGVEPARDARLVRSLEARLPRGPVGLDRGAAYVGAKLASRVGASRGETVELGVPTSNGDLRTGEFRVAEVLAAGAPWQDYFAYVRLDDLQDLIGSGGRVGSIKIDLHGEDASAAAATLRKALGDVRPDVRVRTFEEAGRFFSGVVATSGIQLAAVNAVLLVAVALGLGAVQLLAVDERRREIGAMLALGTPRWTVRAVFLAEAVILAAVSGSIGGALGLGASAVLRASGIGMEAEAFRWAVGGARLVPECDPMSLVRALAAVVLFASLSAIVPAWRAARLDPAKALEGGIG